MPAQYRDASNVLGAYLWQISSLYIVSRAEHDASIKMTDRVRRRCSNCSAIDTTTWRRSSINIGKVMRVIRAYTSTTGVSPIASPNLTTVRKVTVAVPCSRAFGPILLEVMFAL
ncbi:hypothetical protein MPER_12061 [Moniliophthora perniciosa FA553]|nr:hypothetical protein MPER_12061 [Moniliophthora perniciosa FA553]